MRLARVQFTIRRLMVLVALAALALAVPVARRHHLKAAELHAREASRLYEESLLSPEYVEQQKLNAMWSQRDKVPITEPMYKFEMGYSVKQTAEYNRRFGDEVKRHNALATEHRQAASRPWVPTWLD